MIQELCPECGQKDYKFLPTYGVPHTEECKKLQKKLKGDGVVGINCKCPPCQTCLGRRIAFLEKAFGDSKRPEA